MPRKLLFLWLLGTFVSHWIRLIRSLAVFLYWLLIRILLRLIKVIRLVIKFGSHICSCQLVDVVASYGFIRARTLPDPIDSYPVLEMTDRTSATSPGYFLNPPSIKLRFKLFCAGITLALVGHVTAQSILNKGGSCETDDVVPGRNFPFN